MHATTKRRWPTQWQHVDGLGEVRTRGTYRGLPALDWGSAPRDLLATRRQLRADRLCPGGHEPVAVLVFQHRKPARSTDFAYLYLRAHATPTRPGTPGQTDAALRARRTCRHCRREQPYYVSTLSRMCDSCETSTRFYEQHAAEHGYYWPSEEAA